MGNCNCSLKGVSEDSPKYIRVLTDSGSVLEFKGPKLAGEIVHSYPGYGIFKQGHASSPVPYDEFLCSGKFYYLLPLKKSYCSKEFNKEVVSNTEYVENLEDGSALEVLPSGEDGVWRVKLMIDTKKLEEIFSEQGNTEALIERMRMAASSSSLTPNHGKSFRAGSWRHSFSNLFKLPIDNWK